MTLDLAQARVLIVEDDRSVRMLLEVLLARAGVHEVRSEGSADHIADVVAEFDPDAVLMDLRLPGIDGIAALEVLRSRDPSFATRPVLMLTGDTDLDVRRRALEAGARDFLTKPFDAAELTLRLRNLIGIRGLGLELSRQVDDHRREIAAITTDIVRRLGLAAAFRDYETREHTLRVGLMAERIALRLGWSAADATTLQHAAPLHDVGKIGIPDDILLKPGRLDEDEWQVMRQHVAIGRDLLSEGDSDVLRMAENVAMYHHEWWAGGHYGGLQGEAIPLEARIVAVADVYDALCHERPYKPAWPEQQAVNEMLDLRGRQFDPKVVDAFMTVRSSGGLQGLPEDPSALIA